MQLPTGWIDSQNALEKTFELPTFQAAIAFVGRVADLAEEANHHPDIAISYRKVTLRWTTHSAGGITDRDYELAVRSDEVAEPYSFAWSRSQKSGHVQSAISAVHGSSAGLASGSRSSSGRASMVSISASS